MSHQKSKVMCEKPSDPAFIRRIKEKIGYQAGPTVETKKEIISKDPVDSDGSEAEEEQPAIVVLKKGDLNEDEVKAIKEQEDLSKPKKIVFRKPEKSSSDKKSDLIVSSTKRAAEEERADLLLKKHSADKASLDVSKLKMTNLLSFGDDEEEED